MAKGKKAADIPVPTKDTKLKHRGEEENTIKYIGEAWSQLTNHLYKKKKTSLVLHCLQCFGVHFKHVYPDDEPDDGPQHYILIVGFYEPLLISVLDSMGIHVSNVIKLSLQRDEQSEAPEVTQAEENHQSNEDQGKILFLHVYVPY